MYGSNDLFLFDRVDRIILNLDLQGSTFQFASKQAVMAELRCTEEEFLDAGLLAGFDHCPTFPALQDGTLGPPAGSGASGVNIRQVVDLVKQYKSGFTLCTAFAEHPLVAKTGYVDQFCRARCMIKFCLVIAAEEGRILPMPLATPVPPLSALPNNTSGVNGSSAGGPPSNPAGPPILTAADVPVDLHEIFSHRLPDEVFLHLSRGLVSYSVLNNLVSGYVVEVPPFDNGETEDYRRFIREVITETPQSPRCVAIALACSALNGFWSSRKLVSGARWRGMLLVSMRTDSDSCVPFSLFRPLSTGSSPAWTIRSHTIRRKRCN